MNFRPSLSLLIALAPLFFNTQLHAAARCVNAAGAVVAYSQTAAQCPTGTQFKGDVDTTQAPSADERNQAKAKASNDKQSADSLERQRISDERAQSKAMLAMQKRNDGKAKSCKQAELALNKAQASYDNAPSAKMKKSKSKSGDKVNTSQRVDDVKQSKSQKKAQAKLTAAQDRHAIACSK